MSEIIDEEKKDRAALYRLISIFETTTDYVAGGTTVCWLLQNLSDHAKGITVEIESKLRSAIKGASFLKDREIMDDVKCYRKAWPESDWWWWPEKL